MAVGANTYGTVTGVERLIGDIVSGRSFGAGTTPSETQVEAELDNIAADINSLLDSYDYTVPIDETNYATAYAAAKAANEYGAAALLLGTVPSEAFVPAEEATEGATTRIDMYARMLARFLSRVRKREFKAGRSKDRFESAYTGASEDDDGNTKKPLFTRDMDSYPGLRSLTEE